MISPKEVNPGDGKGANGMTPPEEIVVILDEEAL